MGELINVLNQTYERIFHKIRNSRPPVIEGVEEKTGEWIAEVLKEGEPLTGIPRFPLDSKYWVCDRAEFNKIVQWDWTDKKQYISEKYDCDNFAFSFKARVDKWFHLNCVGLVIDWSGAHAYNIVVFKDGTWSLFEPQSDTWPTAGQSNMYKFESKIIII